MPCHNGGVVYFFAPKNRRKMRKGSALDPWGRFRPYESLLPVHSTADKPHLIQSDFRTAKIKLLCVNQSLRRRFSFSFIVWRYPTTQKVFVVTQFFLCYAHSRGEGFVRTFSRAIMHKATTIQRLYYCSL